MAEQLVRDGIRLDNIPKCIRCGHGLMHGGQFVYYRFSVSLGVLDAQAISHAAGMEQYFGGNVGIARVFTPESHISRETDRAAGVLCAHCGHETIGELLSAFDSATADPQPTASSPQQTEVQGA